MNIKPRTIKNVHARRAAICVLITVATIVVLIAFIFCAILDTVKLLINNLREYYAEIKYDITSMWRSDFEASDK